MKFGVVNPHKVQKFFLIVTKGRQAGRQAGRQRASENNKIEILKIKWSVCLSMLRPYNPHMFVISVAGGTVKYVYLVIPLPLFRKAKNCTSVKQTLGATDLKLFLWIHTLTLGVTWGETHLAHFFFISVAKNTTKNGTENYMDLGRNKTRSVSK